MRDAAALARCTLAALIAPQNDPPNGPDLIAWQQFVLVSPGKRVPDIAVGGASNLHGNIGRHDAAFESVIPCDMVRRDIIVLAASAGGLDALRGIVRMLPTRFPAALFVVQHIGPNSSILPALLSQAGPLPASYPAHGQGIMPGHIYVAPPDHHMRLTPGLIHLDIGPKIHFTRPAADPLFQSAALAYGARVVGVVLSGGDGDGAAGLRDVKARGGVSIVQEPNQAENPGMPLQAIKEDAPDYCLRIAEIGPLLVQLNSRRDTRLT